jgi:hypothetical protein
MDKALSDVEIMSLIPEATIIMSPDLRKLDKLPRLPLVILYETAPNFGHWTLLHDVPRTTNKKDGYVIEFFDSYGMKPDDELAFISPEYRRETAQSKKEIVRLLAGLPARVPISYNEYQFQAPLGADGQPVNTCGRWIVLRYLSGLPTSIGGSRMSLDEFRRIAFRWRDPDEWAVAMTEQLHHRKKRDRLTYRPDILNGLNAGYRLNFNPAEL